MVECSRLRNKINFHFLSSVLFDTQSRTPARRHSSFGSFMATTNVRSRCSSTLGRHSSLNDKQQQQSPSKKLIFTGKCSDIFKSTLIDCVDDCVLEFPGETLVYVPKSGQKSSTNKFNGSFSSKDLNTNNSASKKSSNRRNSMVRSNTFNVSPIASTRTRHPLIQQKFSIADNITEEESIDNQTSIHSSSKSDLDDERTQIAHDEMNSFDAISQIISSSHRKLPSAPVYSSYRNRQKDFRLSDLVMNGPEHYANIFNLPQSSRYTSRPRVNTPKERNHIEKKYDDFDLIKRDLFHRYLWTQKPQVSCRIRPVSSFTRSSSFIH